MLEGKKRKEKEIKDQSRQKTDESGLKRKSVPKNQNDTPWEFVKIVNIFKNI